MKKSKQELAEENRSLAVQLNRVERLLQYWYVDARPDTIGVFSDDGTRYRYELWDSLAAHGGIVAIVSRTGRQRPSIDVISLDDLINRRGNLSSASKYDLEVGSIIDRFATVRRVNGYKAQEAAHARMA